MTISTSSSAIIVAGNGLQTTFQYPFVAAAASDITVSSIASDGTQTLLSTSQYTLTINPTNPNQLWGVGGNVVYPLSGSPIAAGTSLLIQRTLPLTQETSVQNQGNYYAQVTEQALDKLCMEIQQVAARTGQIRGVWAANIFYNFGDVAQDGANGNNTLSYYMCAAANTSTTWAADLAAGDWSLVIQGVLPTISLPLPVANGGTGVTTSTGTGSTVLSDSPTFTGTLGGVNVSLSGAITGASLSPTGASIPANGIYLPASNQVGVSSNSALGFSVGYYTGSGTPVNSIEVLNCGTSFFPILQAVGSDSAIGLVYTAKGADGHSFNTNGPQTGSPVTQCTIDHTATAVNPLRITGAAAGSGPTISTSANNAVINIVPNGTGGVNLKGTGTNNSAPAGYVGYCLNKTVAGASAISLTSNANFNIASITLTAGDWRIYATAFYKGGSSTTVNDLSVSISAVSGVQSSSPGFYGARPYNNITAFQQQSIITESTGPIRISPSTTTVYYLVANAIFGVAPCSAYGYIEACVNR